MTIMVENVVSEAENKMFGLRLISFFILVGFFLYCVLGKGPVPGWIFSAFAASAAGLVMYEAYKMIEKIGKKSFYLYFSVFSAVLIFYLAIICDFCDLFMTVLLSTAALYVCIWFGLLKVADKKDYFEKFCNSAGIYTILILPLLFLVYIYRLDPFLLLFLVAVTKIGDTGAYCVGVTSNIILKGKNHKIVPSISPKKSWEGTIAGLICSVLMCVYLWPHTVLAELFNNPILPIFTGVVLFIGGFCGDLTESVMKRVCGVKDSADYIPGMGGVFDFMDSMLLNSVIFVILYTYGYNLIIVFVGK
jgi:phosphatidate cytidylyltransferase